jgi:hypothetical protein
MKKIPLLVLADRSLEYKKNSVLKKLGNVQPTLFSQD